MKETAKYICAVCAILVVCASAQAKDTVAYATMDTWIDTANETTNYGSSSYMEIYASGNTSDPNPKRSGLVIFDLPQLPQGWTIHNAKLTMTYRSQLGMGANDWVEVGLYGVRSGREWVESQATWRLYKTGAWWNAEGCECTNFDREANPDSWVYFDDDTPLGGDHDWGVTQRVHDWYQGTETNRGWLIRVYRKDDVGSEGVEFYAGDYGMYWGPSLTITWTAVPVADADGPYNCPYQGSIELDGSGSYDPDEGNIASWLWDLDNDGDYDDASGELENVSYDYLVNTLGLTPGENNSIGLKVIDDENEAGYSGSTVYIVPEPATLSLLVIGGLGVLLVARRRRAHP